MNEEIKERRNEEKRVWEALRHLFKDCLVDIEFGYYKHMKGMIVTYEDYKPEDAVKQEVMESVGNDWKVVLKREFSDLSIMMTMLKLYKENRVIIVDCHDGKLCHYKIREFANRLMCNV